MELFVALEMKYPHEADTIYGFRFIPTKEAVEGLCAAIRWEEYTVARIFDLSRPSGESLTVNELYRRFGCTECLLRADVQPERRYTWDRYQFQSNEFLRAYFSFYRRAQSEESFAELLRESDVTDHVEGKSISVREFLGDLDF